MRMRSVLPGGWHASIPLAGILPWGLPHAGGRQLESAHLPSHWRSVGA